MELRMGIMRTVEVLFVVLVGGVAAVLLLGLAIGAVLSIVVSQALDDSDFSAFETAIATALQATAEAAPTSTAAPSATPPPTLAL
jgi:hypothetical protein